MFLKFLELGNWGVDGHGQGRAAPGRSLSLSLSSISSGAGGPRIIENYPKVPRPHSRSNLCVLSYLSLVSVAVRI